MESTPLSTSPPVDVTPIRPLLDRIREVLHPAQVWGDKGVAGNSAWVSRGRSASHPFLAWLASLCDPPALNFLRRPKETNAPGRQDPTGPPPPMVRIPQSRVNSRSAAVRGAVARDGVFKSTMTTLAAVGRFVHHAVI